MPFSEISEEFSDEYYENNEPKNNIFEGHVIQYIDRGQGQVMI